MGGNACEFNRLEKEKKKKKKIQGAKKMKFHGFDALHGVLMRTTW
jgi:hypothetical protein